MGGAHAANGGWRVAAVSIGVGGARTTRCRVNGVVWVRAASPKRWASVSFSLASSRPKCMSLMRSGVGCEGRSSISFSFKAPMVVSIGTWAMSIPSPSSTAGERIRSDNVRVDCAMLLSRCATAVTDDAKEWLTLGRLQTCERVEHNRQMVKLSCQPCRGVSIREGRKSGVSIQLRNSDVTLFSLRTFCTVVQHGVDSDTTA